MEEPVGLVVLTAFMHLRNEYGIDVDGQVCRFKIEGQVAEVRYDKVALVGIIVNVSGTEVIDNGILERR